MGESKKEFCVQCDRKLKVKDVESFAGAQTYNCPDCSNIVIRFENDKYQQIYRDIARSVKYGYKSILDYYLEEHDLNSSLKTIYNAWMLLRMLEETDEDFIKLTETEFFILCIAAITVNWSYQHIPGEYREKIRELRNLDDDDFLRIYPDQKKFKVFYENYEKLDEKAIALKKDSALQIISPHLKKHGKMQDEITEILGYMLGFLSGEITDFADFKEHFFDLGEGDIRAGRLITLANILVVSEKINYSPEKVNGFSKIFTEKISDPIAAANWLKHLLVYSFIIDYNQMSIQFDFNMPADTSLGDLEFFRKMGEMIKAETMHLWITGVALLDIVDFHSLDYLSYGFPIPEETIPEDFYEDDNLKIPDVLKNSFPEINAYLNYRLKHLKEEAENLAKTMGADLRDDDEFDLENIPNVTHNDMKNEIDEQIEKIFEGSMFESMQALKGQVTDAVAFVESHLKTFPNDVTAMMEAARFLNFTKETARSLGFLERILKIEPDNPEALEMAVQHLILLKDLEKAQEYTKRILKIDPNNFYANMLVITLLMRDFHLEEAAELLMKVTARHPEKSKPWFMLGTIYAEKEEYEKCIEYTTKALDIEPDVSIFLLELGVAYYYLGKYDEAEEVLLKVLKNKPDEFPAIHTLGIVYMLKGEYDLSYKYLEKSLEMKPDNVQTRIDYGILLEKDGKPEEAMTNYLIALEKEPGKIKLMKIIAENFLRRGLAEEALKYYGKILELEPENYEVLYLAGRSYTILKNYEKALECYDRALSLNSWYPDLLCAKGRVCSEMNDLDSSQESLQAALEVHKGDPLAWFYLGKIHHQKNELDEASKCFENALELMPDDPDFLSAIGTLKAEMGDLQGAVVNLEKSLELSPEDDETIYNLSCFYAKLGRKAESLEKLRKAVELNGEWKEYARSDEDFRDYLEDEEFLEIVK